MKRYIFVDIDGTLANSQSEISIANIKALQQIAEKNYEIVFCSGRSNNYLIDLATKCNSSRLLISSNGSMIFDRYENKILYMNKISLPILEKLYNFCCENEMAITFNTENDRYCNPNFKRYVESGTVIMQDITEIISKNITQIVIGSYDYNKMLKIKSYIESLKELEIVNISTTIKLKQYESLDGFFYDVTLKNVNKGEGIKAFIKIMNTKKENCIAIGDHINDLDMFEAVGYKIAMGNACDELKKNADYITKTNDEDGVKYALDHLEKEFL